jgi:hypothetical protein
MKKNISWKIPLKLIVILMIPILYVVYLAATGPSYEEIVAEKNWTFISK